MDLSSHLAIVVLLVSLWWLLWDGNRRRSGRIPSPPGELPFLGHVLELMKSPKFMLEQWAWQYDSVVRIGLFGNSDWIIITSPEHIARLLKRSETDLTFSERSHNAFMSVGINKFVENLEGGEKRIMRKLIERPFTAHQVSQMRESIVSLGLKLRERLRRDLLRAEIDEKTDPLAFEKSQMNFLRILKEATFDSMMVLGFAINEEVYMKHVNLDDMERLAKAIMSRIGAPFPYWKFYKTKADKEVDTSILRLRNIARYVLQNANSQVERAETMLLKGFLQNQSDSNQEKVDYEMLVDNTLMILFAGYDTTATTIFHLLHWLAKLPHVQEKVQREVDEVLGTVQNIEGIANLDFKERFKYIHAVVRETNRLTPVAGFLPFRVTVDTPLDGYVVPKGTEVLLMNSVAAMKSSRFEDRFDFKPDRWFELDTNDELRKHELALYLPFSTGSHVCPGRHLAMAEMVYFVAIIMSEFNVSFKSVPWHVPNLANTTFDYPMQIQRRK
ncbi:cytochrome P450 [Cladochytrium replicatum]|nr:cytochrome P450 [Cladochytrium replicatum]